MTYNTTPITSGSAKFSTIDPDAPLFIQEQDITSGADPESPNTLYDNANNIFNSDITGFAGKSTPAGTVLIYAGASVPEGYLLCNGAAISRTEYDVLFEVIGTTYGAGNGTTTFNLPDLRGRVVIGVSGTHAIGTTGGAETVTLTAQQIPSHNHSIAYYGSTGSSNNIQKGTGSSANSTTTGNTGGGQSHNNMQPYQTLNYIIKY